MRNLKKILALVLALVMTFGLMSVAGAAFTDEAKITANYAEAVEVMNGMGILKGYDNGSFKPEGKITRAEMAAIIYRIATGDVKDEHVNLYKEAASFNDTKGHWASAYIGFCATKGYIKGHEGLFRPNDNVTGHEAVIMLLRAVGYNKNEIFSGAEWKITAASYGEDAGITTTLVNYSLNDAATREIVAEMTFNALNDAVQVSWTPAGGYSKYDKLFMGTLNETLGEEVFDLACTFDQDYWGRPCYFWTYNCGNLGTAYAYEPVVTYNEAVSECEIATAVGMSAARNAYEEFEFWANGENFTYDGGNYNSYDNTIYAKDYSDYLGAQGRQTEVYVVYDFDAGVTRYIIVMVDTFLATVTKVEDAKYDKAGHKTNDAVLTLTVFDGTVGGKTNVKVYENYEDSWAYAKGDMVLLNAFTADGTNDANVSGVLKKSSYNQYTDAVVLGVAESFDGTQTFLWWDQDKHTVNGTDYLDAVEFHLDEAGRETNAHTWYLDQFGNLIGVTDIDDVYTYGVIKNMWWAGNAADGTGLAKATVVYMDGTTGIVTLGSVNGMAITYANNENAMNTADIYTAAGLLGTDGVADTLYVATDINVNALKDETNDKIIEDDLFRFFTDVNGYVHATDDTATTGIVNNVDTDVINGRPQTGILVNSNTVFLIRNAATGTYTAVTDYNNVGTWVDGYVGHLTGTNGFAALVYINAYTSSTKTVSVFAPATTGYGYDTVKKMYVISGYVDGSETATNLYVSTTVDAAGLLANDVVVLQSTNGVVVDFAEVVDGQAINAYFDGWTNATYGLCTIEFVAANSNNLWTGNVLKAANGDTWNVTNVTTPIYDDLRSSNDVYLIANGYMAYAAYIV